MRFLCFLFWLCVTACPIAFAQPRVVTLCYDETAIRPWVNKAGAPLLKTTAGLKRVDFEQLGVPWQRCMRDVANGTVAGAIGASYTDERAAFAVYPSTADGQLDTSRSTQSISYSLFRVKGGKASWDGKQFMNLSSRVVVQRGYAVAADLTKLGVLVDQTANDAEAVLRTVMAGRSQLGALLTEQGDELMNKPEFRRQFEKLDPPLVVRTHYLVFGKRFYDANARLVEELWDHLAVVREAKGPDAVLATKPAARAGRQRP